MEPFRLNKDKQNNFPVVRLSAPYHQLLCNIKNETGLPLGKIIEQCVDFALRNGGDWERQMLERVTGPLDLKIEPTEPYRETERSPGQCSLGGQNGTGCPLLAAAEAMRTKT